MDPTNRRPTFATTQWSLVLAAGSKGTGESREALASLCQTYWYPLYAYLRRHGHSTQDAEDLVQAFFARLLEKDFVSHADPERGRFRTFLLSALKHFVANEFDRSRAQKRGGHRQILELDADPEQLYALEPRDLVTPERLYERRWAHMVMERAVSRLRREFVSAGRAEFYDALSPFVMDDADVPYRTLSEGLGMTEGALRVAVHRLRKSVRREIEREVAETVADKSQVDEELRFLHAIVATSGRTPST